MQITVEIPDALADEMANKGLTAEFCIRKTVETTPRPPAMEASVLARRAAAVEKLRTFAQDHGIKPISRDELISSIHEGHRY